MTEVAMSQTHMVSCEGTRGLLGSSRALGRASNPPNFRATGNRHKDIYSLYIFIKSPTKLHAKKRSIVNLNSVPIAYLYFLFILRNNFLLILRNHCSLKLSTNCLLIFRTSPIVYLYWGPIVIYTEDPLFTYTCIEDPFFAYLETHLRIHCLHPCMHRHLFHTWAILTISKDGPCMKQVSVHAWLSGLLADSFWVIWWLKKVFNNLCF